MAEGVDTAAAAFEQAINPAQSATEQPAQRAPATRARDDAGRFTQTAEPPSALFSVRMVEGDPDTGDTRDGGDDPRLRSREREIADGRFDPRANREDADEGSRQTAAESQRARGERRVAESDSERDHAAADDGHARAADEQGDGEADAAGDEARVAEADDEDADLENASFEITVDGQPQTVSLGELRDGYIRTATFHSRLNKVQQHKAAVDQEGQRVAQLRDIYIQGLTFLDQDLQGMAPAEPNWDEEFARNPQAAHQRQKEYQAYYNKLGQIRQNRAWAIENQRQENDRIAAQYALDQFTKFVEKHNKLIKDEPSLRRVIGGMRQTALNEGFAEHEVAGVYDQRMLSVLLKAWLYDQGMSVRPQAALPGNGKALVPGSARPIGSAGRRNIDEAQRQLARSGKMEDAEKVFMRLLR